MKTLSPINKRITREVCFFPTDLYYMSSEDKAKVDIIKFIITKPKLSDNYRKRNLNFSDIGKAEVEEANRALTLTFYKMYETCFGNCQYDCYVKVILGEQGESFIVPEQWSVRIDDNNLQPLGLIQFFLSKTTWKINSKTELSVSLGFEIIVSMLGKEQDVREYRKSLKLWFNANPELEQLGFMIKKQKSDTYLTLSIEYDIENVVEKYQNFDDFFAPFANAIDNFMKLLPIFDKFIEEAKGI